MSYTDRDLKIGIGIMKTHKYTHRSSNNHFTGDLRG
jgi:hypothetical protein